MKFFLVSWSDFLSKIVKNGQILVRFSDKIGQIVSQIFANFSQILIISTLQCYLVVWATSSFCKKKPGHLCVKMINQLASNKIVCYFWKLLKTHLFSIKLFIKSDWHVKSPCHYHLHGLIIWWYWLNCETTLKELNQNWRLTKISRGN